MEGHPVTDAKMEYYTQLNRRPLWIITAFLSVLAVATAGFAYYSGGVWSAVLGILTFAGLLALLAATVVIRPKSILMLLAIAIGLTILGVSVASAPSLWFTMTGKTQVCEITAVESTTHRRSPTTTRHDVTCDGKPNAYTMTGGRVGEVRDTIELLIDRTNLLKPQRPNEISSGKAPLLPAALLVGLGFVVLVVTMPRLNKHARSARKVSS